MTDDLVENPREVMVGVRMTRADRARLKQSAYDQGLTVQEYLEQMLCGYPGAPRLPKRPLFNGPVSNVPVGNPREAQICIWMSREDRERLKETAHDRGVTVQGYFEQLVFGYPGTPRQPGRPRLAPQQPGLPIPGEATHRKTA